MALFIFIFSLHLWWEENGGGGGAIVFEKLSSLAAALAAKYAEEGGRGRNTRYQSRITESRFIPGIIGPVRNKRFDDGRKR